MLNVASRFGLQNQTLNYPQDLESIVTFNLTSVCYDNDLDFKITRPIIQYLQNVLVRINFLEDESLSDCIMGIESILIHGGSEGIREFMTFDKIDFLLMKLVEFLSHNLRLLVTLKNQSKEDDYIHLTYPAIQMISSLILNLMDGDSEDVAQKFSGVSMI